MRSWEIGSKGGGRGGGSRLLSRRQRSDGSLMQVRWSKGLSADLSQVDISNLTLLDLITAPRVCNLIGWLLLFAYPTLCKVTLATFDCQLALGVGDKTRHFLRQDTSVACWTQEWAPLGLVSILSLVVYVFGIPVGAYIATRDYNARQAGGRSFIRVGSLHRQRVSLLVQSYRDKCWWFESIE